MPFKANEERETHWKRLIANYHKSGLTKTEFCRRHKIAVSGFYSWFNRLSPASCEQPKVSGGFMPVKLSKEPSFVGGGCQLQLRLPTGLELNFSGEVTPVFVKALVSALGGL